MTKQTKQIKPLSFEEAMAELEAIVVSMEGGQLPLEQSLVSYKRGAELLQQCQKILQDAQQQVKFLEEESLRQFSSAEDND